MTNSEFKIYIEQLRQGKELEIDLAVSPKFLDVHEKELSFTDIVEIQGMAYLAGDALVLHLALVAQGVIPCAICNEPVKVEIRIPDFYHLEPVEEIKGGVFNYQNIVREALLLEVPLTAECKNGKCPKRKEIAKYLKSPEKGSDEGYHPFADL